jgi:hypothetical protein
MDGPPAMHGRHINVAINVATYAAIFGDTTGMMTINILARNGVPWREPPAGRPRLA